MSPVPPRLAIALVLPLALVACGGDDDTAAPAEPGRVAVVDNRFVPGEITVSAGDTVTWEFRGAAVHNVVGDGGLQSENQKSDTFEHTFDEPGEYEYRCTLPPGMDGTVEVE
jgi:plastocyanin